MNNIVVISLEKAKDRRSKIQKQVNDLNLTAHIMDAVDGNLLSNLDKDKKIHLPNGYRFGELFQPGEIACTMSHVKAIQYAKYNNWEYVIILEDDVVLAKDFEKRVKLLFRIVPKDWEHIYISGIPRVTPHATSLLFPNVIPSNFTECTHSMIVRNTAYDKIIHKLSKFETTTDDIYCNMLATKSLISYTYLPFITYADDHYTYIWNHDLSRIHKSKLYFKDNLL